MPFGIAKSGKKYKVINKDTKRVLGTHPSKEKAKKQLAAVNINYYKEDKPMLEGYRSLIRGILFEDINFDRDVANDLIKKIEMNMLSLRGNPKLDSLLSELQQIKSKLVTDDRIIIRDALKQLKGLDYKVQWTINPRAPRTAKTGQTMADYEKKLDKKPTLSGIAKLAAKIAKKDDVPAEVPVSTPVIPSKPAVKVDILDTMQKTIEDNKAEFDPSEYEMVIKAIAKAKATGSEEDINFAKETYKQIAG